MALTRPCPFTLIRVCRNATILMEGTEALNEEGIHY